jgi:glycosyltransferase involved in cell wall biosynthesis
LAGAVGPRRAGRIHWSPYGIDTQRFRPGAKPAGARAPDWLHVADLNPVKDQATLISAFALTTEAYPDGRLHLVGGGPALAGLRRQAAALGVAERVKWWGQIPNRVLHVLYAQADAFVASSLHEGQGVVFAEAAAAGLPIAATDVGMARDLPAAGVHRVPPGDPVALAAAMRAAAAPGAQRLLAAECLREAAVRNYDLAVCAERLDAIYADTVGRRA